MKGYATAYNIYDIPSHFVIYTTISYYVVLYHTITSHYTSEMSAHIRTHNVIFNLMDFDLIEYMHNDIIEYMCITSCTDGDGDSNALL